MILVCDEGVDRPIVDRLREDNHEVVYVAEQDPGATDEDVLASANERGALLVTTDKDFGELVYRQGRATAGVMLVRLSGLPAAEKATLVASTVGLHGEELLGAFSVVTPGHVRIRRGSG